MRKLLLSALMILVVTPLLAAQHLRIDLSTVGATDGPSPGLAIGADVMIDPAWFWTLRASRLAEDDASAHSFTAGLEYGLAAGEFVPYLAGRVGGRWSSEDVELCATIHGHYSSPVTFCSSGEVNSSGLLYQAAFGADWLPKGSHFGATIEAAYTDTTDADSTVEVLVGVSIRP